jgi:hypothetical protein
VIVILLLSVSINVIDSLVRQGSYGARVLCNGSEYVARPLGSWHICCIFGELSYNRSEHALHCVPDLRRYALKPCRVM